MPETIIRTEYSEEMQKSYLDYSMSVITARAIPDARDGLKPVQRRVLYDMSQLKLSSDKPHRKSARIVGDTMGKYHPHGDSSIYETLVVLSQAWKRGMPLVDGHGNFGSIEGDGAAAMRYTEAKLKKFTEDVYLRDLDKTVKFVSNYDETEKEPQVLPVRIPNLLINGAEGIAVGMSTSIPSHNLSEVCEACIAYINNRDISTKELMDYIKGPDFPTGGIIANKSELEGIYESGAGKLKLRGKIEVELGRKKTDKDKLIITEIPYTMIGAGINKFLQDTAALVEAKKLPEIVDISNQSDKGGTRIVFELKKDADIDRIKAVLFKKTKLEDSFGINMLAIVKGRPETLSLKGILKNYLDFQYENAYKKYTVLLNQELEKKEIQEGLITACDCIDLIIAILRGSRSLAQARECLINGNISNIKFKTEGFEEAAKRLSFTKLQAQAILEMRLYKLIGLEVEALLKEYKAVIRNIKNYEKILNSKKNMDELLIADLETIKQEYGYKRRTLIEDSKEIVYEEIKAVAEEVVFLMDRFGYCKTVDRAVFEKNYKKALLNSDDSDAESTLSYKSAYNDYKYIIEARSDELLYIFTDAGLMHQIKLSDFSLARLKDKGTPLDNICKYDADTERILLTDTSEGLKNKELVFITRQGFIKKTAFEEFITNNRRIAAAKLAQEDALIAVKPVCSEGDEAAVISDKGYTLRFSIEEVSRLKKTAKGERAMKLSAGEELIAADLIQSGDTKAVININGKEIALSKFKAGHRNDRGNENLRILHELVN